MFVLWCIMSSIFQPWINQIALLSLREDFVPHTALLLAASNYCSKNVSFAEASSTQCRCCGILQVKTVFQFCTRIALSPVEKLTRHSKWKFELSNVYRLAVRSILISCPRVAKTFASLNFVTFLCRMVLVLRQQASPTVCDDLHATPPPMLQTGDLKPFPCRTN